MTKTEKIYPEHIRADGGTQPRAKINREVYRDYAERMQAGDEFPAITVYFDGKDYWLTDGFHRFNAHMIARPSEPLECTIRQGTVEDAQWHSYGVNKTHGLRRTNEDKKRAVRSALTHWKAVELSNVKIAAHCGVDEKTVRRYRRQMSASSEIPKTQIRTVKRGKSTYQQDTTNIGKSRKRANRRKPSRHMAGRVNNPTRVPVPAEPMTALSLPHDPAMGARTLIEVFDADYLRALAAELTAHLKGLDR